MNGGHQLGGAPSGAAIYRDHGHSKRSLQLAHVDGLPRARKQIHHCECYDCRLVLTGDERSKLEVPLELRRIYGHDQQFRYDRVMTAFDNSTGEFLFR